MTNEALDDKPKKSPSRPERSDQDGLSTGQWIIRALNDLKDEVGRLRDSIGGLERRVRTLEGLVKYVGGVVSALTFLVLLVFLIDRLGFTISIVPKSYNNPVPISEPVNVAPPSSGQKAQGN